MSLRRQINKGDLNEINAAISKDNSLVNQVIKWGPLCKNHCHPLHYLCDLVFADKLDGQLAGEIASKLIEHGADVNGYGFAELKDTPLITAASLHADEVALVLIEAGADIHHGGLFGGTALHWAAWCGRDKVVKRLLQEEIDLDRRCISHQSTAFFWAAHGIAQGGEKNQNNQIECARMLKDAGADITIPNAENITARELLKDNIAFIELLNT